MNLIREKVYVYVREARYSEAAAYLKAVKKKFPNDLFVLTRLATLPFEDAFARGGLTKKRAFKKAAAKILPLLKRLNGQPLDERMRNRNEYYWFSQQFLKQYKLGVEGVKKGRVRSYYSQGVGASNYAHQLRFEGKIEKSLEWSAVAIKAWEKYFKFCGDKYYDPWTWYALAFGIRGDLKSMESALKRASKLANISYRKDPKIVAIRKMVSLRSS